MDIYLLGGAAAVIALLVANQPVAAQPEPQLISRSVIFSYPHSDPYDLQNRYGFNHAPSVTRLPDGRLLAAWFSGPFEASVHQVILGSFSEDEGQTWSQARVLADTPRTSNFDPAFIMDGERTWLFYSEGRWNRYPVVGRRPVENVKVGIDSYKIFARSSDDPGRSWSEPRRVYDQTGHGCRSNGIRLSGGQLLLPIHGFESPHVAGVLRSDDGGENWTRYGQIETPGDASAAEPAIAELSDGRIMMILRSRDGTMWKSISEDRGESWSQPQDTGIPAGWSSHSLFRTSNGHIVLTHNPSPPPRRTPLTMRVSDDDGQNWSEPLILAEVEHPEGENADPWSRQVSYPSVTELEDGTLLAVWTQIVLASDEQSGIIHAARVRVE